MLEAVAEFVKADANSREARLMEWLRIPSISANPDHKADIARAASWVAERLKSVGVQTQIFPTSGNPIVYAETDPVPGKPIALIYGHYDVQPAQKSDGWTDDPFQPVIRGGNVYARGATDDKGQSLTHIESVIAWMTVARRLPLQVKILIEGEEEVGSAGLYPWLAAEKNRLACDTIVISDTSQFAPGRPAITYALRGISYFEIFLTGPKNDLHSGSFGGAVPNPANCLAKMLSQVADAHGKVVIPGFYDDVLALSEQERRQFAELEPNDEQLRATVGMTALSGEEGFTALERRWARPTFDVHGLTSGYQGAGGKTVLPSKASAKFSFRLVPRQDPVKIGKATRAFLESVLPHGMTMELVEYQGAPAAMTAIDSPYLRAAASAIESAFGRAPVLIREGGSIPIVTAFQKELGADTLLLGWGQNDDNAHGPDEKFSLADFHKGTLASAYLWELLSKLPAKR